MKFALLLSVIAALGGTDRSVSPSRQFIVYGDNAALRGAVSDVAEQVKRDTLSILRERDGWKTPIIINIQRPQANVPDVPTQSLRFSQTGAGLKLQLDIVIGDNVRAVAIQREVLRAILLERMYRNHADIAPGTAYVPPPDWLVEGLLARFARADLSTIAPPTLDEFLRQTPNELDTPAREVYRAGSFALVNVIVDLTTDRGGLGRFVDHLVSASADALGDLRAEFPEIDKVWRERVTGNRPQTARLLRFSETEAQLTQALQLRIRGKNLTLADFVQAKPGAMEKAALQMTSENLMLIGANAHPVLRPIVNEYQQIAQLLAAGKRKDVRERLAKLQETRRRLVRRMGEIDDYLNWFEATQMTTTSGVFDDYLQRAQQQTEPQRHDVVSTYLDAVELQTQ